MAKSKPQIINKVEVATQEGWRTDLANMSGALTGVRKDTSSHPYSNVQPNLSVRDGLNRGDYDAFRPDEEDEDTPLGKIASCWSSYFDVPVVHNVINLMSDFSVQGIDLVHPNPEVEKFYKEWWKGVNGPERSERILNTTFRAGTSIIVREEASTKAKDPTKNKRTPKVPWQYTIFSPMNVKEIAPELNSFVTGGAGLFGIHLSASLAKTIREPKNEAEKKLVDMLPAEVIQQAKNKSNLIPIPPEKVSTVSFKKDDGESWGIPVARPILDAIKLYRKMVLADMAALDGALSQVRVWKLGNLELKIFPTPGDVQKLSEILMSNPAGGVIDVIWRPDIELVQPKMEGHSFLGDSKYKQVMADIYAGLGVPPTLSGTANAAVGTTNNMVSIKTLIERLEYARMILGMFWQAEIERVQKAMGFRFPATLVYDRMVLSDDAAELALLIQLADRDYVSLEYIQERFGAVPEIEQVRLRREARRRKSKLLPPKAGPWHDPEKDYKKEMAFIGGGRVSPSQVGLDLPEPDPKELLEEERPEPFGGGGGKPPKKKGKGQPQQGRPVNSKDKKRRKQKRVTPVGASLASVWADAVDAQNRIVEFIKPRVLALHDKSNLRQLTDEQAVEVEDLYFDMLFALEGPPTETALEQALVRVEAGIGAPLEAHEAVKEAAEAYQTQWTSRPTTERLRSMKVGAYLELSQPDEGEEEC